MAAESKGRAAKMESPPTTLYSTEWTEWTCGTCTVINPISAAKCEVCETPRDIESSAEGAGGGGSAAVAAMALREKEESEGVGMMTGIYEGGEDEGDLKGLGQIPIRVSDKWHDVQRARRAFLPPSHSSSGHSATSSSGRHGPREQLGAPTGLLLNELCHSPKSVMDPLMAIFTSMTKLQKNGVHSDNAPFVLYLVSTAICVSMYIADALDAPGTRGGVGSYHREELAG